MSDIVQIDTETEEYKRMINDYNDYINTFVSGFVTNLFSQGIIEEVDAEKLKKYFSNPDTYQKEIEDLAQYYYISSGEIHQLFELIEALPSLNYKIDSFDKNKHTDKYIGMINKILHKVKHKRLTRDLLKQTSASGTLVGIWLGDKNNIYPYVFDDVRMVFPAYRKNGEWQCVIDMEYFSTLQESFRNEQFNNMSPYLTNADYKKYQEDSSNYKYKELPQDRTFVLRIGTLKRNQGLGTSLVTSGLYDVLHKKKLKDVEYSIANKIINAVAVLTVGVNGDEKYDTMTNLKLPKAVKQRVHSGVKQALEKSNTKGVTVVTIPDFAKLDFPDVKTDGLGNKFDSVNSDIQTSYGLSGALLNGNGSNFSAAKLNLETFYKKLGVLLEDIEQECYLKLINLILPPSQKDNFVMEYDKSTPLTHKEKVDILMRLNDKGWSIKHVVDQLDGVSWESYLEQTIYETKELKLQDIIRPYQSTHTMTSDKGGRPEIDNPDNDNTIKSKTGNGNDLPE